MSTPEQAARDARRKRTIWLSVGGAVSLILPLVGVVYIRMSASRSARGPRSSVMFDRREAGETKINVSQTVAIVTPSAGPQAVATPDAKGPPRASGSAGSGGTSGNSSLSFVKGSGDYFSDKAAEAPAAIARSSGTDPPPAPAKTIAKKGGKKAFFMPKLQGVKGFSNFKGGSPKQTGGQAAGTGGGGVSSMLKNLPVGAENNPELQKLLKNSGQ